VGPSSTWSEVQTLQSLDNLLKAGKLTFRQYLERLPDGHIPKKAELLAEVEAAENAQKGGMPQGLPGLQAAGGTAEPQMQQGALGPQAMPQGMGLQASDLASAGVPDPQKSSMTDVLAALVREGAAAGKVHPDAAKEAEELAAQGAPAEVVLGALAKAAAEGRADRAFVDGMLALTKQGG